MISTTLAAKLEYPCQHPCVDTVSFGECAGRFGPAPSPRTSSSDAWQRHRPAVQGPRARHEAQFWRAEPFSRQRNDGQMLPSLSHAKACSNYENPHGTLIYSTQFLHSQIMTIFNNQYQINTELPSFAQGDGIGGAALSRDIRLLFSSREGVKVRRIGKAA